MKPIYFDILLNIRFIIRELKSSLNDDDVIYT